MKSQSSFNIANNVGTRKLAVSATIAVDSPRAFVPPSDDRDDIEEQPPKKRRESNTSPIKPVKSPSDDRNDIEEQPPKKRRESNTSPIKPVKSGTKNITVDSPRGAIGPPSIACSDDNSTHNLEKFIAQKIEAARRSLAYDFKIHFHSVNKKLDDLKDVIQGLNGPISKPAQNVERKLNVNFPVTTLKTFLELDARLTDESEEVLMINLMSSWCSTESPKHGVASILSRLISKDVQILYSGVGKLEKYGGKRNFSATRCFKCLSLTIINRYNDEGCKSVTDVIKYTSTWLARADDRKGGRKCRKTAPVGAHAVPPLPPVPEVTEKQPAT